MPGLLGTLLGWPHIFLKNGLPQSSIQSIENKGLEGGDKEYGRAIRHLYSFSYKANSAAFFNYAAGKLSSAKFKGVTHISKEYGSAQGGCWGRPQSLTFLF
jgi:hypothetical protein